MNGNKLVYVLNFSDENFEKARKFNTKTAYKYGADKVYEYKKSDIEPEFYEKNKVILEMKRGCGYWLWKPYFIYRTLSMVKENEWVIYSDSGLFFRRNIKKYINELEKENIDFLTCNTKFVEKAFTKKDVFEDFGCDEEKYTNSNQRAAGAIIIKNTDYNKKIIEEWLEKSQNVHWITDEPNRNGNINYPEFVEHRHDQSIFSLICKKYNLPYRKDLFLDMVYLNKKRSLLVYHHSNSGGLISAYVSTIKRVIELLINKMDFNYKEK